VHACSSGRSPQSVELTAPLTYYSPPLTLSTPVPRPPASTPGASQLPGLVGPPSLAPGAPQLFAPSSSATVATPNIKRPVYAPDPFMNPGAGAVSSTSTPLTAPGFPPLPPAPAVAAYGTSGLHYSQSTVNLSGQAGQNGMHTSYSSPNLQVPVLVRYCISAVAFRIRILMDSHLLNDLPRYPGVRNVFELFTFFENIFFLCFN
jgi:hypothetical protein